MAKWNSRIRARYSAPWLRKAFFERFSVRTIVVHDGLRGEWIPKLLKVGGGVGHLRFDLRQVLSQLPTALEWVVRQHILPLSLPAPLLLKVGPATILIRHLVRHSAVCDPAEIARIRDEIDGRFHVTLHSEPGACG